MSDQSSSKRASWAERLAKELEVSLGGEYKAKLVVQSLLEISADEQGKRGGAIEPLVTGHYMLLEIRKVLDLWVERRRQVELEMAESQKVRWPGHPFFFTGIDRGV